MRTFTIDHTVNPDLGPTLWVAVAYFVDREHAEMALKAFRTEMPQVGFRLREAKVRVEEGT